MQHSGHSGTGGEGRGGEGGTPHTELAGGEPARETAMPPQWCWRGANPIKHFPDGPDGVYTLFSLIFTFLPPSWCFLVLLKIDLAKPKKQKNRHYRAEYNEMRRIATEADTYSGVNSVVPNYLAAVPSSLPPTSTSLGREHVF